ncbi:hypothetical protein GBF35_45895 [Nonomuraea phyllanthi]|uniref:hypothetical protein n=1 Tax=Nonomuraea phyllanthi TaxID=2219224 RepID=UPI001293E8A2|nr:hypothetical protein [Nonomuraea phyllanthi]QFY12923.1 hypothetical protein GBF35_45895 [Nonomuraea phyllanthi]
MSQALARHLVTTCTRLGDLVIDVDAADHNVISTALALGCQATATVTSPRLAGDIGKRLATTHPAADLEAADLRAVRAESLLSTVKDLTGSAALVVLTHTCPGHRWGQPPMTGRLVEAPAPTTVDPAGLAALLKPGGHLVVVTGLHRGEQDLTDPAPSLIAAAKLSGLAYMQHIVALRVPARNGQLEQPLGWGAQTTGLAGTGLPGSARLHSDVLIFSKPRAGRVSPLPVAEPSRGVGHQQADGPVLGKRSWLEGELS